MSTKLCNVSAVVAMDAELYESSADGVGRTEDVIVSQWEGLPVSAQEVRERVDEALRPLGVETSLVVIRRANSLALYFICLTLSALMSLHDQWRSRQLRNIVQKLFTVLSGATRTVAVKTLRWLLSDYDRCLEFFSSLRGELIISSQITRAMCSYAC